MVKLNHWNMHGVTYIFDAQDYYVGNLGLNKNRFHKHIFNYY